MKTNENYSKTIIERTDLASNFAGNFPNSTCIERGVEFFIMSTGRAVPIVKCNFFHNKELHCYFSSNI